MDSLEKVGSDLPPPAELAFGIIPVCPECDEVLHVFLVMSEDGPVEAGECRQCNTVWSIPE